MINTALDLGTGEARETYSHLRALLRPGHRARHQGLLPLDKRAREGLEGKR